MSGFIVTRESLIKSSPVILFVNNLYKNKVLKLNSEKSFDVLEVEILKILKAEDKEQLKVGDKILIADFHSKEINEMIQKGMSISSAHFTGSANRNSDKNYVVYLGERVKAESGESFWRSSADSAYDKLETYEHAVSGK